MLILGAPVATAALKESIESELQRLAAVDASLGKVTFPKELAGALENERKSLARASATKADLPRLYRLRVAFLGLETLSFVAAHDPETKNLDAFQALWKASEKDFQTKPPNPPASLLLRALFEAAQNRAQVLYRASLPYSKVSSPFSGVYYLAEADANRKFMNFMAKLPDVVAKPETAAGAGGLASALDTLERETIALFQKDPVARTALPASALLKEARELHQSGRRAGAMLKILETKFDLARREASRVPPPPPAPGDERGDTLAQTWRAIADESEEPEATYIRRDVVPLARTLSRSRR